MKAVLAQVVCCCVYDKPKKTHVANAGQYSIHVRLLDQSGCPSPSTKELHDPTLCRRKNSIAWLLQLDPHFNAHDAFIAVIQDQFSA